MTRSSRNKALSLAFVAAFMSVLVACGESTDRERNVRTVAGAPCKTAGRTRNFSRIAHVCGTASGGLVWFVVSEGRSTRCNKPGAFRVTSTASQVCSVKGARRLWVPVVPIPSAVAGVPTSSPTGDSGSAASGQSTATTSPATGAPSPTASTIVVPNAEVGKASLALSQPVRAVVVSMPSSVGSGAEISPDPIIQLVDESGNPRGGEGVSVRVVADRFDVEVRGGEARTDADGRAVFTDLSISGTVGPVSILFIPENMAATAAEVELRPGSPVAVQLLAAPTLVPAGEPWRPQPVVALVDEAGNVVNGAGTKIDARIGTGRNLGTATIGDDGFATFDLEAGSSPGISEVEFSGPAGIKSATSTLTVVTAAANRLMIDTSVPGVVTNGESIADEIALRVVDRFGNVLKVADTEIVLSAMPKTAIGGDSDIARPEIRVINDRATTNSSGVARFANPALEGDVGEWQLTFSVVDAVAVSAVVDVVLVAGAASAIETVTEPAGARSGAALLHQPAFRLVDKSGNPVDAGDATISASADVGYTVTGGSASFGDDGIARFARLAIGGRAGLVEVSFAVPQLPVVKTTVSLAPGVIAELSIVEHSLNAVAGETFASSSRIEVKDASGNRVVEKSVVLGRCESSADWIGVEAAEGIATFTSFSVRRAGRATCNYQVAVGNSFVRATSNVTVVAASASTVEILDQPPTTAAMGVPLTSSARVRVVDSFGNAVEKAGISVRMYSASTSLQITGGTVVTDAGGVAVFGGVSFGGRAGTYRLEFAAEGGASVRAAADTIVSSGSAQRLVILRDLGNQASGVVAPAPPILGIVDRWGNPVNATGWVATMGFATWVGSPAQISGSTASGAASGTFAFSRVIVTGRAGYYLTAYSVSNGQVTIGWETGARIELSAGVAVGFTHSVPARAASGASLGTVIQFDAQSNVVAGAGAASVSVAFQSTSGVGWGVQAAANTPGQGGATVIGHRVYGLSGAVGTVTITVGNLPPQRVTLTLTSTAAVGDLGPSGGLLLTARSTPSPRFTEAAPAAAAQALYVSRIPEFLRTLSVGGTTGWTLPTAAHTTQMMDWSTAGRLSLGASLEGLMMMDSSATTLGLRYNFWVLGSPAKASLPHGPGWYGVVPVRSFG